MNYKSKITKNLLFVFIITLLAGFLRFYNLNWDMGLNFHPDERNIALAITRISFFDQLNPQFFAYGGFLIYLYRALGEVLVGFTQNRNWVSDWGSISLIGRHFSALVSTVSIPLIFIIASRVFGKKEAIYSTIIAAFAPAFIQTAHFAVTESLLVFIILILTIFSLEIISNSKSAYFNTGVFMGLAVATKTSALSFAIIPLVTHLISLNKKNFFQKNLLLINTLLISILVFSIFSPYAFIDRDKFIESMKYEFGVVRGTLPVPYTLQFSHTTTYLYNITNLPWLLGPISLVGILAIIAIFYVSLTKRNKKYLLFTVFPLVYFIYIGSWYTKFIRYMLPIIPFLIISSSWLLVKIEKHLKKVGIFLSILFISLSIIWGLSFFRIYLVPQTRIASSEWIYNNIPMGSVIYNEHWDDGLPLSIEDKNQSLYRREELTMYEPDNFSKAKYLAEKLSLGDYIILNSRRLWGTLIKSEDKYPITSKYYKYLFLGKLGYKQIVSFSSYPGIGNFVINDDASEETFQVYDHPKVMIFKNQKRLSKEEIFNILYGQ